MADMIVKAWTHGFSKLSYKSIMHSKLTSKFFKPTIWPKTVGFDKIMDPLILFY